MTRPAPDDSPATQASGLSAPIGLPGTVVTPAPPAPTNAPQSGVLYPNCYTWYVFLSALDILLTYLILHPLFSSPANAFDDLDSSGAIELRGREVNVIADWVIRQAGVPGMVLYKFLLVVLVIGICEIVGRRRYLTGLRVAEWAIALSCIPVIIALSQMGADVWSWLHNKS